MTEAVYQLSKKEPDPPQPEEIIQNAVSDARFQYFIYTVLRASCDLDLSERTGL
jgi:hypothetical protein